jgi:hypothetical protein
MGPTQAESDFSSISADTHREVGDMLSQGNGRFQDIQNTFARDLESQGMGSEEAMQRAGAMMNDVAEKDGMSWKFKNELGKMASNGNLTKERANEMIRDHAVSNGMNKQDAENFAAQTMARTGLNKLGDKTSSEAFDKENTKNSPSFGIGKDRIGGHKGQKNEYDHYEGKEGSSSSSAPAPQQEAPSKSGKTTFNPREKFSNKDNDRTEG